MAKIYRFFIEGRSELACDIKLLPTVDNEIFAQLTRVLRVCEGDKIVFLNAKNRDGFEYEYSVISAHKKEVVLRYVNKTTNKNELPFDLELVLCLPNKPDKLSFILQKATELGCRRVTLVTGDNSQMRHELKVDRLNKVLKEAAEQSERAYVPELVVAGLLSDFFDKSEKENIFVAMERLDAKSSLSEMLGKKEDIRIVVGPEGGFSEEEKRIIDNKKFKTFSLGDRILRMETAVVLALGLAALNN
jgi:16S rRNA (uracil1498-N3)-methyltransferase